MIFRVPPSVISEYTCSMTIKEQYILALDQGTTSSRAIIFNRDGIIIGVKQIPFKQIFPQPGWVEHDPEEIWATQLAAAKQAIAAAQIESEQILAIGITNQRETSLLWEKDSGKPVYNAIVWQCRRSAGICQELRSAGLEKTIRGKTGLVLDPYFSVTKLSWLFRERPDLRRRAERGDLLFGTIDSWLIYKLTGRHATDPTNASRTLLFDIHKGDWDDELLAVMAVPRIVLPEVLPSSGLFGVTRPELFGQAIPVTGAAGDQQAALFGHACFSPGEAKNTYGTGCFTLMNTGPVPVASEHNLLATVAWDLGKGYTYALEGSVFIAGAVIQWLRDQLGLLTESAESEALARSVPDTGGVYLVPAFVGLGAPYWIGCRDLGHHQGNEQGAFRPRRPRSNSLRIEGPSGGDGKRLRSGLGQHQGRRRGFGQFLSHAVPGRHQRAFGGATRGGRDHGARGGLSGGSRRRILVESG